MSFWLEDYIRMLDTLRAAGRAPQAICDYLKAPTDNAVLLRHDVDRRSGMAELMATRESRAGVRSSYYFRCDRAGGFPFEAIRSIAAEGHEVGYHYEDLSRCGGDRDAAMAGFRRNLTCFRSIAPCVTVSMHGSPLSPQDNRFLLALGDLRDLGLAGDASISLNASNVVYFTDSGGSWNDSSVNLRDSVGLMPEGVDPLDSASLAAALGVHLGRPICFNLHPERWAETRGQFWLGVAIDKAARVAKSLIAPTRG